jgi:predicted enzyme related to lactoylglutathione lyase
MCCNAREIPLDTTTLDHPGAIVQVNKIMADVPVPDLEAARSFYADYLGLSVEEFNMGWVARYSAPDGSASVQLVTQDRTAAVNPLLSVLVEDVDVAYREARERGYEIVKEMSVEPWGVRRFFVREPGGAVLNIVHHPR